MKNFMNRDNEVDEKFLEEIKENPKAMYSNDKKEKGYMILYYITDNEGNSEKSWEVTYGRKATYEFIKSIIEYINLDDSKVVVEGLSFDDSKSVYEFMKHISQYMDDPKFNIDDYYVPDNNSEEE